MPEPAQRAALQEVLAGIGDLAVAVSGGVDSMTLAVLAHRTAPERARIYHAVSPAVPPQATERVRTYAGREGWRLQVLDAGEFADPRYRANPANRCFFCKTNLYDSMSRALGPAPGVVLLSGTNLDDLGDYRPGLRAAERHAVRHPYVEAGIDKQAVRAIARELGLHDLAELPAAPCLSSRVETGIAIDPAALAAVNDVERLVGAALAVRTVRCRIRHSGVVIELDAAALAAVQAQPDPVLLGDIAQRLAKAGLAHEVAFAPYRMGSAFLHATRPG